MICGRYLGDNDATCPQTTCIRERFHRGLCDNTNAADDPAIAEIEDPRAWLMDRRLWVGEVSYTDAVKKWIRVTAKHYLGKPPPGCFFAIALRPMIGGLFGDVPSDVTLFGAAVVGRPAARNLPQDGSWGELTRFALDDTQGLPKGVASRVLEVTMQHFAKRAGAKEFISYHDRSRHSGCIYKKAGMKKDGTTRKGTRRGTWKSRPGREQAAASEVENKRRWRWSVPTCRCDDTTTADDGEELAVHCPRHDK